MTMLEVVAFASLAASVLGFALVIRGVILHEPPSLSLVAANFVLCLINAAIIYLGSRA